MDESAIQVRSPIWPKSGGVNVAGVWGKHLLLPGEACRHAETISNPTHEGWLNLQESTEAIVPTAAKPE